eukprot:7147657-Alexandrium_andersonii.AAC.1
MSAEQQIECQAWRRRASHPPRRQLGTKALRGLPTASPPPPGSGVSCRVGREPAMARGSGSKSKAAAWRLSLIHI